jgi:N-acylneuraminate cytidylyltransferase
MEQHFKSIGLIPLRKNSKGIPNKNKRKLLGRPLFSWVLTEALFSGLDHVYVFTDDEGIIEYINRNYRWSDKLSCLRSSDENAGDTSSTESAILEFCNIKGIDFDVFCLLQASSPLTRRQDINASLDTLGQTGVDAVLSVVKNQRFIWSKEGKSLNYDYLKRPGKEDFEGLLIENGAIYCTRKQALLSSGNRLSGNIVPVEMPEDTLMQIDTEEDWILVEQLLINRSRHGRVPAPVTYLVLDVDGVFTDGRVVFSAEGEFTKTFDMRDGMGLEILREHGVKVMVMTSEDSTVVRQRMKKLKIADTFLGVKDKYSFLEQLCLERKISRSNIAYIGDDVNDLANLLSVGWALCPANATKNIRFLADVVLNHKAADGAIREATEFIINYNRRFDEL